MVDGKNQAVGFVEEQREVIWHLPGAVADFQGPNLWGAPPVLRDPAP